MYFHLPGAGEGMLWLSQILVEKWLMGMGIHPTTLRSESLSDAGSCVGLFVEYQVPGNGADFRGTSY